MFREFPVKSKGKLLFGFLPDEEVLELLKYEGVEVIWNLTAEHVDLAETEKLYCSEVFCAKIPDYHAPVDEALFMQQLDLIVNSLANGKKVYVHCLAGRGRTGMALASIAVRMCGIGAEESLEMAKYHCGGPENEMQKDFVRALVK